MSCVGVGLTPIVRGQDEPDPPPPPQPPPSPLAPPPPSALGTKGWWAEHWLPLFLLVASGGTAVIGGAVWVRRWAVARRLATQEQGAAQLQDPTAMDGPSTRLYAPIQ